MPTPEEVRERFRDGFRRQLLARRREHNADVSDDDIELAARELAQLREMRWICEKLGSEKE